MEKLVNLLQNPTPEMDRAFQKAFTAHLHVRHKARFKPNPTPHEALSAEAVGMRAMVTVALAVLDLAVPL